MTFNPNKPYSEGFTPERPNRRVSVPVSELPSLTRQSDAAACNINNIVAKFESTGLINHLARHQASYGDFSGEDFHTSMNIVTQAQTSFNELPAATREAFNHDPAQFLDFIQKADPETDAQELFDLGLISTPPMAEKTPSQTPDSQAESRSPEGAPIDPT